MELYQLRTFVAVAELGHLTRAAEKLHISQPAVSGQIKALEDTLGAELFERGPAGMTLTHAGRHLLPLAERVLVAAAELRREAQSLKGRVQGKLRVGTVLEPRFLHVGEFLARLVERYPMIEVDLHQEFSGEALKKVRDGELDASYYFGDPPQAPVEGRRLRGISYRVIAPVEWEQRLQGASWADVAAMPWVVTPINSSHRHLITRMFAEHGLEAHKAVEADQEALIADLVTSGVGLSLARDELALPGRDAGRWIIWEKAQLHSALWFVYRSERATDPLIDAMLNALQDVWSAPARNAKNAPAGTGAKADAASR
jgi:DNA-binding transcriptional LysR family regulator